MTKSSSTRTPTPSPDYNEMQKELVARMLTHRFNTGKLLAQQCSALLEQVNGVKTVWETIYDNASMKASETE